MQLPWALRAMGEAGEAGTDPQHLQALYGAGKIRTREQPERWVVVRKDEEVAEGPAGSDRGAQAQGE